MPTVPNSLRYIYIAIFSVLLVCSSSGAFAQSSGTDTTVHDSTSNAKVKYKEKSGHQLCVAYDISRPIIGSIYSDRTDVGFAVDYYLRKEVYLVSEGGWGGSNVTYSFLRYTTTNNYATIGINKSLLKRSNTHDWDIGFFGVRLGVADIQRTNATYTIVDTFWNRNASITNTVPGKNSIDYWAEVTGGMRVELVKNFFLGWTIRGKFLLSGQSSTELAPLYVAGYGKGDKNSIFDFNFYITYAVRWKRKHE
jgi:hypothetical protein